MWRIAELSLVIAVAVAVLALGGTAPFLFLVPQFIVLMLGVALLTIHLRSPIPSIHFPWMAPVLLVALVLLELLPLHADHILRSDMAHTAFLGRARFTSIAPHQTVSHLLLLVTYMVAFYLVLLLCQDRNAKRRLVYVLVALGTFEAFYGLLEYLTGWQQIFTYVKKYYLEDATGTYINRNHFAGFLEMILPFVVAVALGQARVLGGVARRRVSEARGLFSSIELPRLVFWCFVAATIFTALIFSRSRMGIISALISLLAILTLAGTSSLSWRSRSVVGAIFFLSVIGLVIWIGYDPVITRFETLGQESSPMGPTRIAIWRDTLKLIHQHPLVGTGLGTFSVAYPSVQTVFLTFLVDHAHCDYLEVVSEIGLPGGILLFGSIVWILTGAVRHYRKIQDPLDRSVCLGSVGSITSILVHSVADFNLYIPANALVFAVILALACSTAHAENERNRGRGNQDGTVRLQASREIL